MPGQRPFLARRLKLWELVAVDTVAAAVLLAVHISFLSVVDDSQPPFAGPLWFGWLISAVATVPVAVRRLWPVPMFAVALLGSMLATFFSATREPWIPAAAVLYVLSATNRGPVVSLVAALACTAVASVSTAIFTEQSFSDLPRDILVLVTMVMVTAWALGRWIWARRSYAATSARQLAESMVNDERLRIARELHDIVAHSMSLIAVKAGIANHVADQRPEEARDALRVIESTSRNTLNDMRRMLGVLRSDSPELAPAPGLSGLPELAERARSAGVAVTMTAPAVSLPSGVEMSVYRIVQEALTNVVKHAGPVPCTVTVTTSGQEVRITVVDSGPGGTPGSGHGLIGMRERVMMYGGEFSAGPLPTGGFAVSASLPYTAEAS
ncbi:Integral membrane sensor signal transduction histidine kinase [Kibdelosporangium sp. 4NS15]|uniref:histidine kinase n=1 Tax=Kibdelosporangium persicum TaxID=2698649 RepID=A0ABX2FI99_9PSEU|nr:sensor histidine kinase [Kibdelosporangium persicum]NRN70455.1 Integral membrane sensor signal transduction histidine kinase [Kibdelosporangium persicum]